MGNLKISSLKLMGFFCLAFALLGLSCFAQSAVTYDGKGIIINGHRKILISGSIHYTRSTPDMWQDLIQKAKDGGLDVIDTYVFWNVHEPSPGHYSFEGNYNLVEFIRTVHKVGLYVNLRIGPYICGEWNFGGIPVWLKYVPGIAFRTNNEPFKRAMQGFTQKIVQMMKSENLFASQGGPIILSQIENEYGSERPLYGASGAEYVNWAAKMAVGLGTGVPWIMCKEDDAPDPVINTCNGFYCDTFQPNKPSKPKMWTEAWSGWFTDFGGPVYERPVEDLAFAVGRFIQSGGSYFNYYMYHGGTNFGRTAGGPFITTSYDYDAPIDEYGLIRQPKYGHLKDLHQAIKLCEEALVSSSPTVTSLGSYQQAHVFEGKGKCAAFLANYHLTDARVLFNNKHYNLPAWSVSILPDCKNEVYNSGRVGVQTSRMEMLPTHSELFSWHNYDEDLSSLDEQPSVTSVGLLDQINVTRDSSDYLWYLTSVEISPSEKFLHGGKAPTLYIDSKGHALHVFINGHLSGSAYGSREIRRFRFNQQVNLRSGINKIALLSVAVGLQYDGPHFETANTGILGPVVLRGLNKGNMDLSRYKWSYRVGLRGEALSLDSPQGSSSEQWTQGLASRKDQPLTWHKAYFDAPQGNEPLALDMKSMGKGQVWINGNNIGRYWTAWAKGNCSGCNYAETYRPPKCQSGCGAPTQRWYHVPRSWLKPEQNLMIVFEELGGDASKISLVKRSLAGVCAEANEHHPTMEDLLAEGDHESEAKVHLHCAEGQTISSIKFASFGTPSGACGSFATGSCHAPNTRAVFEKYCLGLESCTVSITSSQFGGDPCPNVFKKLYVEAICS